jgi:hypothetical protein
MLARRGKTQCSTGREAIAEAGLVYTRVSDPMSAPNDAAPQVAAADPQLVAALSDGTKVKQRLPRMRACNEKDAKGKICAGHLKRWYFFGDEVKAKYGAGAEIYRCEHCKTLYLPNPDEQPRTGTLSY